METAVETKKPLSERLEQLITNLRTNQEKPKPRDQANLYQPFSQERCVICELLRIDKDPTGLTCGNPKCLSELGARFNEIAGERSIVEELTEDLTEIANQLGLDTETLQKEDIDGLLKAIAEEISAIQSTVEESITEELAETATEETGI